MLKGFEKNLDTGSLVHEIARIPKTKKGTEQK
jgi:hypothetical protein